MICLLTLRLSLSWRIGVLIGQQKTLVGRKARTDALRIIIKIVNIIYVILRFTVPASRPGLIKWALRYNFLGHVINLRFRSRHDPKVGRRSSGQKHFIKAIWQVFVHSGAAMFYPLVLAEILGFAPRYWTMVRFQIEVPAHVIIHVAGGLRPELAPVHPTFEWFRFGMHSEMNL